VNQANYSNGFTRRSLLKGFGAMCLAPTSKLGATPVPDVKEYQANEQKTPADRADLLLIDHLLVDNQTPILDSINDLPYSQIQSFSGDVTALWFDQIKPRLSNPDAVISGLTYGDSVFCLRHLASELGWKLDCHKAPDKPNCERLTTMVQTLNDCNRNAKIPAEMVPHNAAVAWTFKPIKRNMK
jgi:hypothetical protein